MKKAIKELFLQFLFLLNKLFNIVVIKFAVKLKNHLKNKNEKNINWIYLDDTSTKPICKRKSHS